MHRGVMLAVLATATPLVGMGAQQVAPLPFPVRYEVVMREGADTAPLVASLVRWRCRRDLWSPPIAAVTCWAAGQDSLRSVPGVQSVTWDRLSDPPPPEPEPSPFALARADDPAAAVPWHLALIRVDSLWNRGLTGEGVTVGIIDSGIDPTHATYGGRVRGFNVVTADGSVFGVNGQADTLAYREETGCRDHGTHVTGSAVSNGWGVAPGATAITVRVFEQISGSCRSWQSSQQAGIMALRDRGASVISASIGGTSFSSSYAAMIQQLRDAGILFTGAAGNSGTMPEQFPGGYPASITVASINSAGTGKSSFSNWGSQLDVGAPGEGIVSTMPSQGTASKTGTSMATPQVAGVVALIRQRLPDVSADSIVTLLRAGTRDLGPTGCDDQTGCGLVDGMELVRLLFSRAPMIPAPPSTAVGVTRCVPVPGTDWTATTTGTLTIWRDAGNLCWRGTTPGLFTVRLQSREAPTAMAQITVDPTTTFQTVDGFGTTERLADDPHLTDTFDPVTLRSAVVIPQSEVEAMWDALYIDLGLTRVRYATQRGVEDPNDNADPNIVHEAGFNYAWKRLDGHTDWVAAARSRGVTTWWGSPIDPESWMGLADVPEYVENTMQILRRWRALGQELPLWSIANEPGGALNPRSPEFHRLAILDLGPKMAAEGMITRIVLADDDKPSNALLVAQVVLADPVARSYVAAVATHLYPNGGPQTLPSYTGLTELSALAASHGLPLWMTEWSNQTEIRWAITMHELFTAYNVSAIDYMWGFFGQWDFAQLIVVEHTGNTYTGFAKRPMFGTMGQWSRYVRPGMVRVSASGPAGLLVSAYSGEGKIVVVAVNPNAGTTVDLGCPSCGTISTITRSSATEINVPVSTASPVTLPANSTTTFVYTTQGDTMSMSNTMENELLLHYLHNAAMPGIGDAGGLLPSAAAGVVYLSLYTADPGEAGTQATNETAYGGYARVAKARSAAGFVVTGNSASPAADVTFGEVTATPGGNITFWGIGDDATGPGKLRFSGPVSPAIVMGVGVVPVLKATSTIVLD